jgi:hypothetical protein
MKDFAGFAIQNFLFCKLTYDLLIYSRVILVLP